MFGTDGRYCVTKGKMSFWVLLSCLSADSLPGNFISHSASSIRLRGKPLACKRTLKSEMFSSKATLEEFVRRSCYVLSD